LALNEPIWNEIHSIVDQLWFLNCDLGVAMERVERRHVKTGICMCNGIVSIGVTVNRQNIARGKRSRSEQ
jgi:hypothetical protein